MIDLNSDMNAGQNDKRAHTGPIHEQGEKPYVSSLEEYEPGHTCSSVT